MLGSLAGYGDVTGSLVVEDMGIDIDDLESTVEGNIDEATLPEWLEHVAERR